MKKITFTLLALGMIINSFGQAIYGDSVLDIDGNEYQTVIIGKQQWLTENLRVTKLILWKYT